LVVGSQSNPPCTAMVSGFIFQLHNSSGIGVQIAY
jgi:hypothetical protein